MAAMKVLRQIRQSFGTDQRGTATIELAVVLPVLLTIGLGVIEFGNMIYRYHLISTGVRDAARYAAGFQQGAKDAEARNIAARGVTTGGTNRVDWWIPSNVAIAYTTVANNDGFGNKLYRGGANIVMVTVSTSVPYQPLGFLGYLGVGTINLSASHEERLFGVR